MALAQMDLTLENVTQSRKRNAQGLMVPQTGFISSRGRLLTIRNLKKLGIDANGMKRDLNTNGYLYPFGYDTAPERVELQGDWEELTF